MYIHLLAQAHMEISIRVSPIPKGNVYLLRSGMEAPYFRLCFVLQILVHVSDLFPKLRASPLLGHCHIINEAPKECSILNTIFDNVLLGGALRKISMSKSRHPSTRGPAKSSGCWGLKHRYVPGGRKPNK